MEKIETMYERDETLRGHPVKPGVKPSCAWVEAGEGLATRKLDGVNVRVHKGLLYKRQKPKDRDYDRAAYVPCLRTNPSDRWMYGALEHAMQISPNKWLPDGIYEAIGPHFQGNPEQWPFDTLVSVVPVASELLLLSVPRNFDGLKAWLEEHPYEGIVFHHPDGRLAKIKRRDFGLPWPIRRSNV